MNYKVVVEYDGCTNWEVDHPEAIGPIEDCIEFISRHLPPKDCEFGIVNTENNRHISFMFTPQWRRIRLHFQDLKET
jgi:hypothetical protein